MRIFSYIIILLLFIFGVSFALLNANVVAIHYYLGTAQLPLSFLLMMSFSLGIIVTLFIMGFSLIHLKTKNLALNRSMKSLEKEIEHLKTTQTH